MRKRGKTYWILVVASILLCIAGHLFSNRIFLYYPSTCNIIFRIAVFFAIFCLLFEIETLSSAKKHRIPKDTDRCLKLSYALVVFLSLVFPAITALKVLNGNLSIPAVVLGMFISYSLLCVVWFFMLLPFGHNCRHNLILCNS